MFPNADLSVANRTVAFTVGLIVVLGLVTVASWVGVNPYERVEERADRAPASQQAQVEFDSLTSPARPRVEHTSIVDLNCLGAVRPGPVEASARMVRLKARLCSDDGALAASQVQNRTNGFVGTTFHLDARTLTTDYIELARGENDITLNVVGPGGASIVTELRVLRR